MPRPFRRVLYLQYANPATLPPLEHSSRILAEAGWHVRFFGTDAMGEADRMRFPPHTNIRVEQLPYVAPGWRQKVHYLRFTLGALLRALTWRPNWIYASDVFVCPALLLVQLVWRGPVLYHEHDIPSRGLEETLFGRICMRARKAIVRHAALRLVPTDERAELLRDEFGQHLDIMPVRNYPTLDELGKPRGPIAPNTLRVYYHGSISPLLIPLCVIQALVDLPAGVTLTIAGYSTLGQIDYPQRLIDEAARLGVANRVAILSARPRRELLDLCAEHDVGLALLALETDDLNLQSIIGASNKISDYFSRGLALVVPNAPGWRETFVDTGMSIGCDPTSCDDIARVLLWGLEHPAEVRAIGERGRRRIAQCWNYEREFAPVLERLAR